MTLHLLTMSGLRKIVSVVFGIMVLFGCQTKPLFKGIWTPSYLEDPFGVKHSISAKTILDFSSRRLLTVDEYPEGGKDVVNYEKFNIKWVNDSVAVLSHDSDSTLIELVARGNLIVTRDTTVDGRKVIFRRIDGTKSHQMNVQGSYVFTNKSFQDSLDFITDSLVLSTGEYYQNRPLRKWYLVGYKKQQFLTFEGTSFPLMLITKVDKDSILLKGYSTEVHDLLLRRTSRSYDKSQLIGIWKEVRLLVPKPPPPPGAPEGYQYMELLIEPDSIHSNHLGRVKTQHWMLTGDGKRIYFPDNISGQDGSWKILKLTKDTLSVRLNTVWSDAVDVKLIRQD